MYKTLWNYDVILAKTLSCDVKECQSMNTLESLSLIL